MLPLPPALLDFVISLMICTEGGGKLESVSQDMYIKHASRRK